MLVKLAVAMTADGVIGRGGGMPWHIPEDLKRFKRLTTGQVVVMGSGTYTSIAKAVTHRGLPKRVNVVLSSQAVRRTYVRRWGLIAEDGTVGAIIERLKERVANGALCTALDSRGAEVVVEPTEIWIIGGANVYAQAMPYVDEAHVTLVRGDYDGDTFFDVGWLEPFELIDRETGEQCDFLTYRRKGVSG